MIPEPVAAVSVAMGLLGFVVTTLSSTIEKGKAACDTWKEHETRLNAHRLAVRECDMRLKSWYKMWESRDTDVSRQRAEDLWGQDGVQHIEDLERTIAETGRSIRSALEHALPEESSSWTSILRRAADGVLTEDIRKRLDSSIRKMCDRVAVVLWKNNALKEPVANLKSLVSSLESTAKALVLDKHGHHRSGNPLSPDGLLGIIRTKDRHERISNSLRMAYEDLNGDDSLEQWALIPTHFRSEADFPLESMNELLSVEFLKLHDAFEHGKTGRWVSETIPMDLASAVSTYAARLRQRDQQLSQFPAVFTLGHSVKRIFELVARASEDELQPTNGLDAELLKTVLADTLVLLRLQFALRISSSTALLRDSMWIDQLCTCSIRRAVSQEDDDDICAVISRTTAHHAPSCNKDEFNENHALLLGLTLAELAIARPVCIRRDDHGQDVYHIHSGTSGRDSIDVVGHSGLICRISDAIHSKYYTDAVEYCLLLAQGLYPMGTAVELSRAYELNVVKPLERVYTERQNLHDKMNPKFAQFDAYWKCRFEEYVNRDHR